MLIFGVASPGILRSISLRSDMPPEDSLETTVKSNHAKKKAWCFSDWETREVPESRRSAVVLALLKFRVLPSLRNALLAASASLINFFRIPGIKKPKGLLLLCNFRATT